jgi:hypothetical protein
MSIDWDKWWPHWKTPRKSSMHDSETEQAPYMVTVQASHVSGDAALFDSEHRHQGFVALRIHSASRDRGLGRDWIHADRELIEVNMSHAQWAAMISTQNSGSGVPATLQHILHERVEPPKVDRRTEKYGHEMLAMVQGAVDRIDELSQTKMTKAQQSELAMIRCDITSSISFVADSFDEHMETRVERAKSDIEAHMNAAVQRVGLAALGSSERLAKLLEGEKQ